MSKNSEGFDRFQIITLEFARELQYRQLVRMALGDSIGIIELTKVLRNMEATETKAVQCFTNNVYTDNVKKWSFDSVRNMEEGFSMAGLVYMEGE